MGSNPTWGTMKNKIAPRWVLQTISVMDHKGVDIHDWESVKSFLSYGYMFDMLEWVKDHRQEYTYAIMSRQHKDINFYYGEQA